MRSWKILRGGKGSNFLSFLAPGGGDGTWFRILEKKSSTRLAASLCVKFWNDVQFFHSQRMCGKSSGSTCWLWKIMLITFEYNIKQKPIEITQCFLSFHFILVLCVIISLVLNSLWGTRKKMKFLVEEQGKFKEFLSLHFHEIYPKSKEKRRTNISKKTSIFLRHNF